MLISIDNEVLKKYPQLEIGYLVASVTVQKSDLCVESFKRKLGKYLEEQGINATNFTVHPSILQWRKIYENDFQMNPKTYRSSIEALLRRVVTGKEIWNICNIVDLYNCCSIVSLLPMGGYDLKKISGNITIRYAQDGESFLGLGEKEKIATKSNQVVYADDERIICWLWNHKDSVETCIDQTSNKVLFFVDSFDRSKVQLALKILEENLENIKGLCLEKGILNRAFYQAHLTSMDNQCF